MRGLLAIFVCGVLVSAATAGDVTIVGPSGVRAPGLPCELFIQGDLPDGTEIGWDYFPRFEGLALVESRDNGRRARINTVAGRWKLVAFVHVPGQPIVARYHDFEVPGGQYVPPPGPAPTPFVPVPVPPKPSFGIGHAVTTAAKSVGDPVGAIKLADRAKALAIDIREGKVKSAQDAANAIAAAVKEAGPNWAALLNALKAALKLLLESGRLTADDVLAWADLLDEIQQALREAAKR